MLVEILLVQSGLFLLQHQLGSHSLVLLFQATLAHIQNRQHHQTIDHQNAHVANEQYGRRFNQTQMSHGWQCIQHGIQTGITEQHNFGNWRFDRLLSGEQERDGNPWQRKR